MTRSAARSAARLATRKKRRPQPYTRPDNKRSFNVLVYLSLLQHSFTMTPCVKQEDLANATLAFSVEEWRRQDVYFKVKDNIVTMISPLFGEGQPILELELKFNKQQLYVSYFNWDTGLPADEVAKQTNTQVKDWLTVISLVAQALQLKTIQLDDSSHMILISPSGDIYKYSFWHWCCFLSEYRWTYWQGWGFELLYGPLTQQQRRQMLFELNEVLISTVGHSLMYYRFHLRILIKEYKKHRQSNDANGNDAWYNLWYELKHLLDFLQPVVADFVNKWQESHDNSLSLDEQLMAFISRHSTCKESRIPATEFTSRLQGATKTSICIGSKSFEADVALQLPCFFHPGKEFEQDVKLALWNEALVCIGSKPFELMPDFKDYVLEKRIRYGGGYCIKLKREAEPKPIPMLNAYLVPKVEYAFILEVKCVIDERNKELQEKMPVAMDILARVADLFGAHLQMSYT